MAIMNTMASNSLDLSILSILHSVLCSAFDMEACSRVSILHQEFAMR